MTRATSEAAARQQRLALALQRAVAEAGRARTRHGTAAESLCAALADAQTRLAAGHLPDEAWIGRVVRDAARWSGDDDLALLAALGAVARAMRAGAP